MLRFNRPAKKNAITQAMYTALAEAIAAGEADDGIGAHVFMGSGGVFSAGSDLKDFLANGAVAAGGPVVAFLEALGSARKPLIAAVEGNAIGIGATMLLHCDLVYASPAARLSTPFLDLGVVPEAASSLLLPQRAGHLVAFEMLCLGVSLDAGRALAAGLINAVLPAGRLEAHALAAAAALAAKPREALLISRRLMRADPAAIRERMKVEFGHFAERLGSPEAREAMTAFLEKRPPDFTKVALIGDSIPISAPARRTITEVARK